MGKRVTVTGEVMKLFTGVSKEIRNQTFGKPRKGGGKKNRTIHIHYHINKGGKR